MRPGAVMPWRYGADYSSPRNDPRIKGHLAALAALDSIGLLAVLDLEILKELGLVEFVRRARHLGLLGLLLGRGWSFSVAGPASGSGRSVQVTA
jgi:hypothetical protein